jgi:hypothetical protein
MQQSNFFHVLIDSLQGGLHSCYHTNRYTVVVPKVAFRCFVDFGLFSLAPRKTQFKILLLEGLRLDHTY